LFDLKARFFAPTHIFREPARAGAVKIGRRAGHATTTDVSRPYLDCSKHDGTLEVVGMTLSRGARCCSVETMTPHPCIRRTIEARTHDACMRIGGEAPRRRTHSTRRHESHARHRATATSNRHRHLPAPKLSDFSYCIGTAFS